MKIIQNSIEKAKRITRCSVENLNDKSTALVRSRIESLYAEGPSYKPLWERLNEQVGVFDPDGWKTVEKYPFNDNLLMFFDLDNEKTMYLFSSIGDVVKILSECPGFVFYLTDCECTFLLCHNDHDYLIGAGDAKGWVSSR